MYRSSSNHKESSLYGCIGSLSAGDFVCSPQMPHHQAEMNDNRQHTTDPDIQQLNITIWTHNQKSSKQSSQSQSSKQQSLDCCECL
jgi:hypothetical protein